MLIILFIGLLILFIMFPALRCAVSHPIATIRYGVVDLYHYFKYKKYDWFQAGFLNCYIAHFGGGKTLSATKFISESYHRYNNKRVFDYRSGRWVLQKINVISNCDFSDIPYTKLESLSQIVDCSNHNMDIDEKLGTRTCTLVLIDEASAQLNSRSFKNNISPDFLGSLVTCRHFNLSICYTSQKFNLTDKLLRDVTQTVIHCHKVWRFMVQRIYDADSLEYASDPTMVQPLQVRCWFVFDKYFKTYDTLATVDKLQKSFSDGDLLSEEEILNLRGSLYADNDLITKPSRKLKKIRRKK